MTKPDKKKSPTAAKAKPQKVHMPKGPPVIFPKAVKPKDVIADTIVRKAIFHTGFATQWRIAGAKYPGGLSMEWGAYAREAIQNEWGDWAPEARETIAVWADKAKQMNFSNELSEAEHGFFGGVMTRGHFVGRVQFWTLAADMLRLNVLKDPEKDYDHMSDMWHLFKTRDTQMFTALVSEVVARVGALAGKFLKYEENTRTGRPLNHLCVVDFNLGDLKFTVQEKDVSKVKTHKVIDKSYAFQATGCGIAFYDEEEVRLSGWKTPRHSLQPKEHWVGVQYKPKVLVPRGPVVRPR